MNICEKHSMTMIEIGCEKCIEEIVANARNEGHAVGKVEYYEEGIDLFLQTLDDATYLEWNEKEVGEFQRIAKLLKSLRKPEGGG